jgi:1-acyl-sn-glycerol-3-phosphate acyltransferase
MPEPLYIPPLGPNVPAQGNRFTRGFARWLFHRLGWRFEGELPNLSKFVAAFAPHTTAWDFIIGMIAIQALGIRARWLGADWLFHFPLMRTLGGVPVNRSKSQGLVSQTIEHFENHEHFVLALSPEGSRKKVVPWKTGYYHIAVGAGVPILPFIVDQKDRRIRFLQPFYPCGDYAEDFERLRDLYTDLLEKYADRFGM